MRPGVIAHHVVERTFKVFAVSSFFGLKAHVQGWRRLLRISPVSTNERRGRIPQYCDARGLGNDVEDQLKLLGGYLWTGIERGTCDVATRPCQAGNEALADWVSSIRKDDRDLAGSPPQRVRR